MSGGGIKNLTGTLASEDVNDYLAQQAVAVYDSAAAREAQMRLAGVAPSRGMMSYLRDSNTLHLFNGAAWVPTMRGQAGGNLSGSYPSPTLTANFAAKEGPSSWISAYKSNWTLGFGRGDYLDATQYGFAIYVRRTAIYECWTAQRSTGADNYVGLGIDGDRTAIENRSTGIWAHDHEGRNNSFTTSYYIGVLNAGELLTAGGVSSGSLLFGSGGTAGFLSAKLVGV